MNDFDEVVRFKTMTNYEDSDYDWVNDKEEVTSYVFFAKDYTYDYIHANLDGDTYRKELDWDNDADNSPDGCEDADGNGFINTDIGETFPFYKPSVQLCIPRMQVTFPKAGAKLDAGPYNKPKSVMLHLDMELPESLANNNVMPTFKASEFAIAVGDRKATVTAIQQLGDTARVMIALPKQLKGGVYNMVVSYTNDAGNVTRYVNKAFKYKELPYSAQPTPTPLPFANP